MKIKELRSQFTVFILLGSADEASSTKATLSTAGYDSFVFLDQEVLLQRLQESPPHVIVFSIQTLSSPMSEFVKNILSANSEIKFVCVGLDKEFPLITAYRNYNFDRFVSEGESLSERVLWAVDEVCESLIAQYQNEELIENYEDIKEKTTWLEKELEKARTVPAMAAPLPPPPPPTPAMPIDLFLLQQKYHTAQSKEEIIYTFLQQIEAKGVYVKYLSTVQSFVVTVANTQINDDVKDNILKMAPEEIKDLNDLVQKNELPLTVKSLLQQSFQAAYIISFNLLVQGKLEGCFVFMGEKKFTPEMVSLIQQQFVMLNLNYLNFYLQKKADQVNIYDPVTDLFNVPYFQQKMDEELSRARRLQKPVSLVKISIDNFLELEQSLGRPQLDVILKSIAIIIKKTSRINDITCRTQDNEISLILPHCARKGAALRAERLRRIIENQSFALSGLKITVASGVSEYPTLCSSISELEQTALKALDFIIAKGGNKVCLFKPTQEFKPDFEVT